MKKLLLFMCMLGLCSASVNAQQKNKYLSIGDTLPDHTFTDLVNYPSKTATISNFRGKWLILDFWGYTCSGCIASFPKMDKLSKEFKDKAQLIMVAATKNGFGDTKRIEKLTKDIFARHQKKYKLQFTNAFDSVMYMKHDIGGVPHIMVIDPEGIIRAKITRLDSTELAMLISGKMPEFKTTRSFSRSEPRSAVPFNRALPLLTKGSFVNGGIDTSYLFRSILTEYNYGTPGFETVDFFDKYRSVDMINSGKIDLFSHNVQQLYNAAYFGLSSWDSWDTAHYNNFYPKPIFNENPSLKPLALDSTLYCYSLSIPRQKSTAKFVMNSIQQDLERYFGYSGKLETRKMPVYYLVLDDRSKITKMTSKVDGKESQVLDDFGEWKFKNFSLMKFLTIIKLKVGLGEIPVIVPNVVDKHIDVDFKANLIDAQEVTQALNKLGIRLVKSTKDMQTLILYPSQDN